MSRSALVVSAVSVLLELGQLDASSRVKGCYARLVGLMWVRRPASAGQRDSARTVKRGAADVPSDGRRCPRAAQLTPSSTPGEWDGSPPARRQWAHGRVSLCTAARRLTATRSINERVRRARAAATLVPATGECRRSRRHDAQSGSHGPSPPLGRSPQSYVPKVNGRPAHRQRARLDGEFDGNLNQTHRISTREESLCPSTYRFVTPPVHSLVYAVGSLATRSRLRSPRVCEYATTPTDGCYSGPPFARFRR